MNSNIGIVGLGVVGSALKNGFEKIGYKVKIHDLKLNTTIQDIIETNAVFLCLPTPSRCDGSCDLSIIENVIEELTSQKYNGIIIIKSTVVPGTTKNFIDRYNESKICFVPEFLRERCAEYDFVENQELLAIGTESEEIFEFVKKIHGDLPKKILKLKPTEAELLKYFSNTFNALRIVFANEFFDICKYLSVDYKEIKNSYDYLTSMHYSYLNCSEDLRGFGGACLPKDVKALDCFIAQHNLNLKLFSNILEENSKFHITVFEGMRK